MIETQTAKLNANTDEIQTYKEEMTTRLPDEISAEIQDQMSEIPDTSPFEEYMVHLNLSGAIHLVYSSAMVLAITATLF